MTVNKTKCLTDGSFRYENKKGHSEPDRCSALSDYLVSINISFKLHLD